MVTCKVCADLLGVPDLPKRFDVGARLRDDMGHAVFASKAGRIALCVSQQRELHEDACSDGTDMDNGAQAR